MKYKDEAVKILVDSFQLSDGTAIALIESNIVNYEGCRNHMIRKEYAHLTQDKKKGREFAKIELAEKYSLSFSMVEKIVLNLTKV